MKSSGGYIPLSTKIAFRSAFVTFAVFLTGAISTALASSPVPRLPPPSTQQSLDALKTQDGIRVSLAASEPAVIDPVSIRFDEDGRMWVVEMRDYPTGPKDGNAPDGRIVVLSDADNDGVYETSVTFASGLVFPTGLQPWRNGVIVTLAGKIEYMADTNGDLVCDRREVWFEGFTIGNEQLRANHPMLGPDGLVYVAGGLRGGRIVSRDPRWPMDKEIDLRGKDFAFDPDADGESDGFFAGVSGSSQFGLTIDDFGHRIGCSNRNPAIESLVDLDDLSRSRWPTSMPAYRDVSLPGGDSEVRPIADAWTTSNLHAGQFSAACGVTRGLGTATPTPWRNDLVVCEPTGYLVQRQTLQRRDVGWKGQRSTDQRELLASSHPWFRPVDTTNGPDGALYVVDMCRAVIEHPKWVPAELKQRSDERDGDQLGRIWRITRTNFAPGGQQLARPQNLTEEIKWLSAENPFQRSTATRLLLQRSDETRDDVTTDLKAALVASSTTAEGFARALQLLLNIGQVDEADIQVACQHRQADVRRVAARSLRHFPIGHAAWTTLADLLQDDDEWVRWEAVGSACIWADGQADDPTFPDVAMADALSSPSTDLRPWLVRAETTPSITADRITQKLLDRSPDSVPNTELIHRLARQAALVHQNAATSSVAAPWDLAKHSDELQISCVAGFLEGLAKADQPPNVSQPILRIARRLLVDQSMPTLTRQRALSILLATATPCVKELRLIATQDGATQLRINGITALLDAETQRTVTWLESEIALLPTELRVAVISQMTKSRQLSSTLLSWMEEKTIPTSFLPPDQADRLTDHADKSIRDRAVALLRADRPDRDALIREYLPAIQGIANISAGRTLFVQHCSACHRIDGYGVDVGPDISDSRSKTPESLLTAILDPSGAIDAGFTCYRWLTLDGQINTGVLLQSNQSQVTFQVSGGQKLSIDRVDLDEFTPTGKSLMPDGFERVLSINQMRDLVGYLKAWRYQDAGDTTFDLGKAR